MIGTFALASIVQAPQDSFLYAEEYVIVDNTSISSLSNMTGINTNDPKWILGKYVAKYRGDYDYLSKVIMCESGFRHDGVFGDSGKAYGIAQFHEPTFLRYCSGDWKNMDNQLDCFTRMMTSGLQSNWTCAK